jgi:hypothetical protein
MAGLSSETARTVHAGLASFTEKSPHWRLILMSRSGPPTLVA